MSHETGCTEVTPECPVSATTYGYRPNLAGNIVLLVVFGICTVAQLVLGLRYRLRAFTFAVSLGCLGEALGYGGRLIMNDNPWSKIGFQIQIVCLILAPSFLAAGIYLTLKHLARMKVQFHHTSNPPRPITLANSDMENTMRKKSNIDVLRHLFNKRPRS